MKILNGGYLVLILFFLNCSSTKFIYESALSVDKDDKGSIFLLEKVQVKKDQSIIFFTETFDNIVEIKEDEKIVYNKRIETIAKFGYSGSYIISNDKEVTVTFDYKKRIILNKEKLPKYKFIYFGRYKNKYTIEYTNKARVFL